MTTRDERLAQLVVDEALDAVVITNGGSRIIAWNRQAEKVFGWPAAEAMGRTLPETILPPERLAAYAETLAAIAAAETAYGERREGLGLHRDGRVFAVEVSIAALDFGDTRLISHFIRDISERKIADESLRATNELLDALLESLPLPVNLLDGEGRVTLWNKACEQVFGWTAEEALGQFVPTCPPDGVERLRERQRRVFAGETLADVPVKGVTRDGTLIDLSLSVAPVRGADDVIIGSLGIVVDVTEQKRASEALRETNELLQALLDASPLPIAVVDLDGRTKVWNDASEREFGWTAEEALGRMLPIIPPEDEGSFADRRDRVFAGEMLTDLPARRLRRDGTRVDVSLSVAPLRGPDGTVCGSMGISMDVSERTRAFEVLRAADDNRRRLLSKLVRAQEEERQRIAADIHDDSVQVLTALTLRLELLRRRLDDPSALSDLAEAERTARQAITRLRHLMFELRPPALDRDGLAPALRMHLEQAKHDSGFTYSLEDGLDCEPAGDARALVYRIAQEALVNIAKHARATNVEVQLRCKDGNVVVRVADDGCGFDPDAENVGHLGIVFMRERAEMAGGWCRFDSAPGRGTVVEFAVPSNLPRETAG